VNIELSDEVQKLLCNRFNKLYPVGAPVLLVKDSGMIVRTTIQGPAVPRPYYPEILLRNHGICELYRVIPAKQTTL
jgi:hypothetical protein